MIPVLTIGHSTLSYVDFLSLLRHAGVTALADVRTSPFSRYFPHFNRDLLKGALREDGIPYVFLGKELGGRPSRFDLYAGGVADYEKMARTEDFQVGLARIVEGAKTHRIALMCSEHHPLDCHRCLLVGRALADRALPVEHILSNGHMVPHSILEDELLRLTGRHSGDFFAPREERLALAYRDRARKVAYTEQQDAATGRLAK